MNNIIKFSFDETEALINLLRDTDKLTPAESAALMKLRKIQARQVLSHEKRQYESKELRDLRNENQSLKEKAIATDNNAG